MTVRGGGLLALVSKQISYTHSTRATMSSLPADVAREVQTLTIKEGEGTKYRLGNVFIPPSSACPTVPLLCLWGYEVSLQDGPPDPPGGRLEVMTVLNKDSFTRLPFNQDSTQLLRT